MRMLPAASLLGLVLLRAPLAQACGGGDEVPEAVPAAPAAPCDCVPAAAPALVVDAYYTPPRHSPFAWCSGGVCFPIEVEFDVEQSRLSVGDAQLVGNQSDANPSVATFHATAAELGFSHPTAFGIEMRATVAVHRTYWGLMVGLADAQADVPGNPQLRKQTRSADLLRVNFGALAGVLFDLPLARVRADVTAGVHALSIGLDGLRDLQCQDDRNCHPMAHSFLPLVAPRVALEVRPLRAISIGAFASTDLLPRPGDDLTLGGYLSLHAPGFGFE